MYQPTSDLPVGIHADEKRLRQVLLNLLGNAIKFTNNGGVTFKVCYLSMPENHQPTINKIRFQIEDTGFGMTPEQLEKIFLPFEQVGSSKHQGEGTGLGLAISAKIIQMMGSTIQVQSKFNQGSIFWMDLDLPGAAEWMLNDKAIGGGKIVGYHGKRRKIMIVDDSHENRSVIANLLEPIGFEVTEASNGKEGLESAMAIHPDLIISDLLMPVMDGFEMMRQMRCSSQLANMLIIVSSASVYDIDKKNSLAAGGNDFLPKPIQAEELFEKLQHHLELEWIYDDSALVNSQKSPVKPTNNGHSKTEYREWVVPDKEELSILWDLAMKGRVKHIIERIDNLEKANDKFIPFAQHIRRLAKNYEIKKIRDIISEYQGMNDG